MLGPKPDARSVIQPEPASLRLFLRNLQPLPPPDTLDTLGIHRPTLGPRSGDGGRGSEVSRGSLFQDQLLQRQLRHSLAQPVVLFLKLLEAFHLVALQATKLLAPPVIRELRHADRTNRFANRSAL